MSSKSFRDMTPRTMPDRDMLVAMERDLRFIPSDPQRARYLHLIETRSLAFEFRVRDCGALCLVFPFCEYMDVIWENLLACFFGFECFFF